MYFDIINLAIYLYFPFSFLLPPCFLFFGVFLFLDSGTPTTPQVAAANAKNSTKLSAALKIAEIENEVSSMKSSSPNNSSIQKITKKSVAASQIQGKFSTSGTQAKAIPTSSSKQLTYVFFSYYFQILYKYIAIYVNYVVVIGYRLSFIYCNFL